MPRINAIPSTVEYAEMAFGCACKQATRLGWAWYYEGDMIWVKQPEGNEVGCSGRRDFIDLVYETVNKVK